MKKPTTPDFVVIDDDPLSNLICTKIIQITIPGVIVSTFINPEKGLDYLLSKYSNSNVGHAILFLDINMPCLSGWDVLDRIRKFPPGVKEKVKIFMLSSSVNPNEEAKAYTDPLVSGYVTKSLSKNKLIELMADYVNPNEILHPETI